MKPLCNILSFADMMGSLSHRGIAASYRHKCDQNTGPTVLCTVHVQKKQIMTTVSKA